MEEGNFSRQSEMRCSDGHTVTVQWAATTERVTGRRLVLFVALSTSRWGAHPRRARSGPLSVLPLTARELEVVHLIALGSTGPEIADELQIANDTVRAHARNAMLKSGARSRAHLVAKVLGEGLILRAGPAQRKPEVVGEAAPNGEAAAAGAAGGRGATQRGRRGTGLRAPGEDLSSAAAAPRAPRRRRRLPQPAGSASAALLAGGRRRPRLPTISETTVTR